MSGGGGGHIFIYSCYAQLISFEIEIKILKSIVFTVCEQEYMNICPPPPTYRSSAAPDTSTSTQAQEQEKPRAQEELRVNTSTGTKRSKDISTCTRTKRWLWRMWL